MFFWLLLRDLDIGDYGSLRVLGFQGKYLICNWFLMERSNLLFWRIISGDLMIHYSVESLDSELFTVLFDLMVWKGNKGDLLMQYPLECAVSLQVLCFLFSNWFVFFSCGCFF
ncbi:unnamed protein product [Eruca vesicaria subsp. sativa]|uniref:Uncharacterized protein n=1 Tax=Eruca vesicaria subsp. sativa TaxID=29727 RepID=A0ABC8K9Y4_ERUVS|nr:unnamed protein product [Eruca vesicaria subsp. sativa]